LIKSSRLLLSHHLSVTTLALGVLIAGSAAVEALADNGASSHNMTLVGTNDLQARSTYQPTVHKYPNNRYILFAVYIVDRANTGLHILRLEGDAREIVEGKD
jgi:hypothetical protein